MKDNEGRALTRDEQELITFFRGLPPEQQLDIIGAAETSFNALERMKALASRQVERDAGEDGEAFRWH